MTDGRSALSRAGAILRHLLRRAEVDRAVAFASLTRLWTLVTGPVTLLMIARYFTPAVQGYYYTFVGLLALQTFVELGLSLVVINVASHEWSRLGMDETGRIVGDREALSRLVSLGRWVFKWYGGVSAAFVLGVGLAGHRFFSRSPDLGVAWQAPWFVLVALTGLLLWMMPFNALLEGCNQVEAVHRFRLGQSVAGSVTSWLALACGAGLWAPVAALATHLVRDASLLLLRYRTFFRPFLQRPSGARIDWKTEVWPLQWRIGLSGLAGCLTFSLFNLVMFRYHGADVAGRMGLTLALVNGLLALAHSWLYTRSPRFGMLIARGNYVELDRVFLRVTAISLLIFGGCAIPLVAVICGLGAVDHPLAHRMLGPLPTGLLLISSGLVQLSFCMTLYLRAHKREPTFIVTIVSGLAMGLAVWFLGRRYGPVGAAAGHLGVYTVAVLWQWTIWERCRACWHGTAEGWSALRDPSLAVGTCGPNHARTPSLLKGRPG